METIGALKELIKAEQTHDTTIPALSHKKLIKHWRIWSKQTHETAIQAWSHHSFVETSAMLTGPTKAEKNYDRTVPALSHKKTDAVLMELIKENKMHDMAIPAWSHMPLFLWKLRAMLLDIIRTK